MRIWGITGTNGKTTTTWITAAFINADPTRRCGYVTTVEVDTFSRRFSTGYTTPPLAQLKEIFAEMEANGCTDCVMEVSSHAIHQNRVGFGKVTTFSSGAFTNLSEDHLDYHKTMEEYFRVKLSFAEHIAHGKITELRNSFPPFIVCLDGGYGEKMLKAVESLPVNVIPVTRERPKFDLSSLSLVGAYNQSNVLVAAALAEAAGISHETIQATIPTLKPRWGRLERVENPNVKATVYVDFAHTPDGLEKVLIAVREEMKTLASSHSSPPNSVIPSLWIVFGAGGNRDPMKRPLMGEVCSRLANRLVITSDNPRNEDPQKIIADILSGIPSSLIPHPSSLTIEPDRKKAIEFALREAKEGDVIIIAGKGHETTQEIAGIKYPFDDREEVRNFTPTAGRTCEFQRDCR